MVLIIWVLKIILVIIFIQFCCFEYYFYSILVIRLILVFIFIQFSYFKFSFYLIFVLKIISVLIIVLVNQNNLILVFILFSSTKITLESAHNTVAGKDHTVFKFLNPIHFCTVSALFLHCFCTYSSDVSPWPWPYLSLRTNFQVLGLGLMTQVLGWELKIQKQCGPSRPP